MVSFWRQRSRFKLSPSRLGYLPFANGVSFTTSPHRRHPSLLAAPDLKWWVAYCMHCKVGTSVALGVSTSERPQRQSEPLHICLHRPPHKSVRTPIFSLPEPAQPGRRRVCSLNSPSYPPFTSLFSSFESLDPPHLHCRFSPRRTTDTKFYIPLSYFHSNSSGMLPNLFIPLAMWTSNRHF